MDTIFALATAQGKAGVSIVRISGPDAENALNAFVIAGCPSWSAQCAFIGWQGRHTHR